MSQKVQLLLKELGFSTNETKAYLALTLLGEAEASKIAKKAGLPRTTVISILNQLTDRGFISLHQHRGTNYYWIESPRNLEDHFANQAKLAQELQTSLTELYRQEATYPTAEVYDTKQRVKEFIKKTLYNLPRNTEIATIDSTNVGNYEKVLSEESGKLMLDLKKQKNIQTRTLIPYGGYKTINPMKLSSQNITVKELPEGINYGFSIWLVQNQLVIFSGKPPFIISIKHPVIVASWTSFFEYFWSLSAAKR